jgi:hypothetical protein
VNPISQFDAVWSRCDTLSGIYTYLDRNVTGVLLLDELLRAEWVARVSALDLYVHELVAQSMLQIFEGLRPSTPAFNKFSISGEILQRIRTATSQADATAAFDLYVREQLGRITYQAVDDIADGIRLISTIELWNEIALALGATPTTKAAEAKSLKLKHSLIMRRRNSIAHEGDLRQTSVREPWPICEADVAEVTSHILQVVRTIEGLI